MKTILHIGMSKTGSTALQHCLSRSRDILMAQRVLYPENPVEVGGINHKFIMADLLPFERLPRHLVRGQTEAEVAQKQRAFREMLLDQVIVRQPRCTVISTESLFRKFERPAREALTRLMQQMQADVTVAAYLRSPAAHYLSAMQQHFKASARLQPPRFPNYRPVLEEYEKMFSISRLQLFVFNRALMPGGDIVTDFAGRYLTEFGIDPARLRRAPSTNESLSAESVALLQAYRARFLAQMDNRFTADSNELIGLLAAADQALERPRPVLRPGLAERIDYASDTPLWLRERFGVEFPDYDYRRLERGQLTALPEAAGLQDLLLIDPQASRDLAAWLGKTDWAGKDPARAAWLKELGRSPVASVPAQAAAAQSPARAAAGDGRDARADLPAGAVAGLQAGLPGRAAGGTRAAGTSSGSAGTAACPEAVPPGLFALPGRIARGLWDAEQQAAWKAVPEAVLAARWPIEQPGRTLAALMLLNRIEAAGGQLLAGTCPEAGRDADQGARARRDPDAQARRLAGLMAPEAGPDPAAQAGLQAQAVRVLQLLETGGYRLAFPD